MSQVTARRVTAAKVAGRQITGAQIGVPTSGAADTPFTSLWATTGSNETITIPCQDNGTFNAVIDWGDGTANSSVTAYNDAGLAHEYASAGDHTIEITGVFPNIYFNNGGDRLKIKKVLNLGTVGWIGLGIAFAGCANLTEFTAGSTDTTTVTNMGAMFFGCSSLNDLDVSSLDTSNVNSMGYMFLNCSALTNLDVSSFDTAKVTSMCAMFFGCSSLTNMPGVEDFNIEAIAVSGLSSFITGGKTTTAQYDSLLINWEAQAVLSGLAPSFGASTYTGGGAAATARAALIASDGWTISDGGIA